MSEISLFSLFSDKNEFSKEKSRCYFDNFNFFIFYFWLLMSFYYWIISSKYYFVLFIPSLRVSYFEISSFWLKIYFYFGDKWNLEKSIEMSHTNDSCRKELVSSTFDKIYFIYESLNLKFMFWRSFVNFYFCFSKSTFGYLMFTIWWFWFIITTFSDGLKLT